MIARLRTRRQPDERGFVMVMTALMIVVLMTMAAFAVDIGAWYSRAAQIQRAADASALAGVVFMPQNLQRARAVALETAAKNGFVDPNPNVAGDTIDITVDPDPNIQQRLRVTITDHAVNAFFAKMFLNSIEIGRLAVAHYAEPLPLGSPENMLGIGPQRYVANQITGMNSLGQILPPQNFYVAVNGRCAAAEEGDLLLSQYDGNALSGPGGGYTCAGEAHPQYDQRGYVFNLDFALPLATQYKVQIWDPAYNPAPDPNAPDPPGNPLANLRTSKDYTLDGAGSYSWNGSAWVWSQSAATSDVDTTFRLTAPDMITPLDFTRDDQLVQQTTYLSKQAGVAGRWVDFTTLGPGTPGGFSMGGKYRMTVLTDRTRPNSWGVNVFALRVLPYLSPYGFIEERFSTIAAGAYGPYLPKVYGLDYLSIYANAAGSSSEMYLAQIAAVHAGKRIQLDLWDPGEGGRTIEILDPNGTPINFTWTSPGVPGSGSTVASLNLGSPCLNPSSPGYQSYSQPGGGRAGRCQFNDRSVAIEFDVPPDYTGTANGGWWRIRYNFHAAPVTDRTTWQIRVEGDPVHLVDDGG